MAKFEISFCKREVEETTLHVDCILHNIISVIHACKVPGRMLLIT